jgi:hypothetical protein
LEINPYVFAYILLFDELLMIGNEESIWRGGAKL